MFYFSINEETQNKLPEKGAHIATFSLEEKSSGI
jgi:hypothetical protein